MTPNLKKLAIAGSFLFVLITTLFGPVYSFAADDTTKGGLVLCGREADATSASQSCTLNELVSLVNRLVKYLVIISMPIVAIAFAYAGFQMITAQGNPGKISSAKEVFSGVAIGFIIILSAWLIVSQVAKALLNSAGGYKSYIE